MILFSYGSNMNPERLLGKTKGTLMGVAVLKNWKLVFNKVSQKDPSVGFANIIPFWGEEVEGVLFDIESMDVLDKQEGYPSHYQKTTVNVKMGFPEYFPEYSAVAYVAIAEKQADGLEVSEEYKAKILDGIEMLSESYKEKVIKLLTV